MIIPNHTSFVDVAFLAVYIPLNLSFAIDLKWSKIWWVRIFTKLRRTIPVDSTNPLLARNLIDALKEGQAVVVFPEGRITSNGSLTKIYDGPGHIASRCGCPVIPVFFRGLEYTSFGRLKDTLKNRPKKNKVSMTVFGPIYLEKKPKEGESRPAFRERLNWEIYNILTKAKFESQEINLNVYQALLETAYLKGEGRRILEDIRRNPISYKTLIKQIKVLASYFRKTLPTDQYVGLICPNSTILAAAIFALWADSKVAVMLNYSQGLQPMLSAIKACDIKTVISLEAFIEQGKLSELVNTLPVETIYLDRLKLSFFEKLKGLFFKPSLAKPSEPAAVLFTSGFEGRPKGAVLSHSNLLSDIYQAVAIIGLNEDDVLFNSMPAFHAFGLNVGLILPLIYGLKGFVHPNPLKLKEIPELIYDTRSTVVIGSDTFAAAWGKNAHPYDFSNVNFMFLGAERLKPSTVDLYLNKLSLRVFEGYGVTEASPILAISNRMRSKKGSAGQFLPGVKWRLEPVEGLKEGGKLMVKGPNVMLGYLRAEKPKVIAPLKDGWHDTGDVAQVDNEGFLFIKGRAHRFAKISGEMISLAAIEEHSALLWPDNPTAVLSIVDPTRGEKLVLVYEKGFSPDLEALKKAIRQSGLSDLYIPKTTAEVEKIPLTPLGKVNAALLAETLQESLKEDRGGLKG
jgi:acyl-[acyl-carrier-protein]-phospholipid O-acyltransferase/long-chain-fatty-acid--[acyl-carrier-protein] ligase